MSKRVKTRRLKIERVEKVEEFYMFNDKGFDKTSATEGQRLKIAPERCVILPVDY